MVKFKGQWTHDALCNRALRWLSGTRRCQPVFNNIASCAEIPDAIGWSSCYGHRGSTVVECKTSMADFYADKKKYWRWQNPNVKWDYFSHDRFAVISKKERTERGYREVELSRMGNYRFFMCEADLIAESAIKEHAPDHGLLYCKGRSVRVIIPAPLRSRELTDYDSEIRYLRFAIINSKKPFCSEGEQTTDEGGLPVLQQQMF